MAGTIDKFINIFVKSEEANASLSKLSDGLDKASQGTARLKDSQDKSKKALLENGGAMGLLSAATGGLANDFKDAVEAAQGLGFSMKGLRGAIIATGIGALAIIVLELITNWEKWISVIDGSSAELAKLNMELENTKKTQEYINTLWANEVALAKARGDSEAEVAKIRKLAYEEQRAFILKEMEDTKALLATEMDSFNIDEEKTKEYRNQIDELAKKYVQLGVSYQIELESEKTAKRVEKIKAAAAIKEKERLRLEAERIALEKELTALIEKNTKTGITTALAIQIADLNTQLSAQQFELERVNTELADYQFYVEKSYSDSEIFAQNTEILNSKFEQQNEILTKQSEIKRVALESSKSLAEEDLRIINNSIQALESKNNRTDIEQQKLEILYQKRIEREYEVVGLEMQLEGEAANLRSEIQLNSYNQFVELQNLRVEAVRMGVDARIAEEERYSQTVQTLYGNVYSFLDQLQNEQLIRSKDLRNVLLVAQKGAQIAEVVINTVRENSKLKQQAGEYAGNAALYGGLSAALAVVDPITAASYGAAATQYAVAGSRSLATIPLNWGIAGASIASIAATTLTSWNRSSGGGGSAGGGGGGAGASPQFNIVGSSGNNQLAAQIAAQQNQPVRAYVVGADVTTQQAFDRNVVKNSTFLSILFLIGLFII